MELATVPSSAATSDVCVPQDVCPSSHAGVLGLEVPLVAVVLGLALLLNALLGHASSKFSDAALERRWNARGFQYAFSLVVSFNIGISILHATIIVALPAIDPNCT